MTSKLLAMLLLGSGCSLLAAEEPPSHLLSKVVAQGGHAIREVEGGVLFERQPGPDCRTAVEGLPVKPLAASLGTSPLLALEVAGCRPGAPAPAVECHVQVGGTVAVERFEGWTGTLRVPMPSQTGIYPVQLRCSVAGREEALRTTLYLTYAPPREPVNPPREAWYRRACEWAAGMTSGAKEARVLERILHGLYGHGQRTWRYGYCTVEDLVWCTFGNTSLPLDYPGLIVAEDLGTCEWPSLTGDNDEETCNFTDCFGYSRIFEFISSTMGIMGFTNLVVPGSRGRGFATQGWLRTLDPGAPGNLVCGYRNLPCAFLFNVHDLRVRDGVIYDSTFGRTYLDLQGLIAENIIRTEPGTVVLDRGAACLLDADPYGGFPVLREIATHHCPRTERQPAVFYRDPAPDLAAELKSITGDDRPEVIRVDLKVEVREEGTYTVLGFLYGGAGGEILAADQPTYNSRMVWPHARISGPPGIYRARLSFSGEDLAEAAEAGIGGPYWLQAAVVTSEGISDELSVQIPKLPGKELAELGERAATLGGIVLPAERVALPGGRALRVRVPVKVRNAGPYALDARLYSGDQTLVYSGRRLHLSSGNDMLTVDFPGEPIARRGIDGPYAVTVELYVLEPGSFVPLETADTAQAEIGPFRAADFVDP